MSDTTSSDPLEALGPDTLRSVADSLWQSELDLSSLPDGIRIALTSEKNSPEAYGERMQAFLRYLSEHPVEHAPSYEKTYEHLLPFCTRLSPPAGLCDLGEPPRTTGVHRVRHGADEGELRVPP